MGSHRLRLILIIAFTAVVLGVGTTAVLAAAGPRSLRGPIQSAWPPSCATPALTGAVVDVTLTDMGAMMGRHDGLRGQRAVRPRHDGSRVERSKSTGSPAQRVRLAERIPGGEYGHDADFRQSGHGAGGPGVATSPQHGDDDPRSHGAAAWCRPLAGQLAIGANGQVDKSASLAEAARSCGPDDGDGILPATTGWTTVTLTPGRYELLCNIAGHYGAGMYTELDVVSDR